jgi:hypothetical protein
VSRVVTVLLVILLVVAALLLLTVVSGLVVWAASGLGWVLINWLRLPFTPFEATLLSLIALIAIAWSAWRLLINLVSLPLGSSQEEEDWDEDEDEDYEEDEEPEQAQHVSSIPKWRQPIRRASDGMPIVNPDDRCPCGSGRKYKNCHGRTGK